MVCAISVASATIFRWLSASNSFFPIFANKLAKFFDLKVQSTKDILRLDKKRNVFLCFHFFRKNQIYSHLFHQSLLNAFKLIAASFVAPARKVRIRLRPSTVMTCRLSHSITIQLPCPVDPSRSMNLNDLSLLICFWTAVTDIPILFAISLLVI